LGYDDCSKEEKAMVSQQSVELQLKGLGFNYHSWGRTEVGELHSILLPDEEILEIINGVYDAGFALLLATNIRVILVDKKPLNYLTVEDMRFDMINELDYSHRLFSAQISISAGNKNLKFRSYNQPRLRKLINHVQHLIAELKKQQVNHQEGQNLSLDKLNQQLQAYLMSQYQGQIARNVERLPQASEATGMSEDLRQYLEFQKLSESDLSTKPEKVEYRKIQSLPTEQELYQEGIKEIFSTREVSNAQPVSDQNVFEINPSTFAYSKLPMILRKRRLSNPISYMKSQPPIMLNDSQVASIQ
jgi:hypothetical protein